MADADKHRHHRPAGKKPPHKPPPKPRKSPMNEPKPSSVSVFEVDRIRRLVELMKEHDLSEVDLRESRQRIRICRGPKEPPRPAYGPPPPPPPPPPASSGATAGLPSSAAALVASNLTIIKSPMVCTFYASPNPQADLFV